MQLTNLTDPVELARQMIDIPSVSGDEGPLADAVEAALRGAGFGSVPSLEILRDGDAVCARTRLGLGQRVVLAGHLDTVPIADNVPGRFEERDGATSWFYLFKTPSGLRLRVVGESASAADSIGLRVNYYKYLGILISGVLCGIAGSFLSVDHINMFVRDMTAGRGFIAVAVNILGRYNPIGALGGGLLFGFADSLQLIIPSAMIPGQILQMIPYVVTLFVIIFAVRYVVTPAGMGEVLDH